MGSQQRFREEERLHSVGQQDQMTGRDVSLKSGKDPTLGLGVKVVLSPACASGFAGDSRRPAARR